MPVNTVNATGVPEDGSVHKGAAAIAIDSGRHSREERRAALCLAIGDVFNPFNLFDGALVPNQILRSPGLLPSEKLVFARLTQFAGANGRAWPSVERLSEEVSLSVPQTRKCVRCLEEKGFIRRVSRSGRSNEFEFLWHAAYEQSDRRPRLPAIAPLQSPMIAPPQSSVIAPPVSPKIAPGRSPVIARKESFESSSSIEKIQKEENQVKPETRPRTWEPVGNLCRTLFVDENDARLKPGRDSLASPEEEFLERLRERHGKSINPEAILQSVLDALEWQTTDLKQFLDFDTRQTTAPEKLTNPAGHYRRVAEKFRLARAKRREIELKERQRDLEKSLRARRAQEQPPKPKCSLSRCDGNGEFWDESGFVSACQCEAGKQLPQAVLDLFEKLNAQRRNSHA